MRALPLLLVLAFTVLVFAQVVGHELVSWDDDVFLYQNPTLHPPTTASLKSVWTGPYAHLYAPVTYTAWWGLARLFGPPEAGAMVYHLASLLVHLMVVVVVFLLLLALVEAPWAAAAGAALFALHPLQVETVAWASELKDLLGGLFGLLGVYLYVRARSHGRVAYLLATVAFILAILSKPNLVALPLLALTVDTLLLKTPWRRALLAVAPWLAIALAHALLTRHVQPPSAVLTVPLWQRLFVAGDALAFYLGKLTWPFSLAADYGRKPTLVVTQWWGYVTWLAPVAVLAAAVVLRRKSRWALPGLLWFGLALLPVLGLLPFDFQQYSTPADHYAYVALFGAALALAELARHAGGRRGPTPGRTASAPLPPGQPGVAVLPTGRQPGVAVLPNGRLPVILLLVLLAAQSGLQTITWAHNGVFWRHTLDVNPKSALAHNNLGGVYMTAGGLPEAAAEFEAALRIQPDDPDALVNLGMVLLQLGRMQPAKDALERGLRVRPGDPKAHLMLGMMALQAEDYFTALDHLQPAAAAEPQNLATRVSLAQALAGAGRTDDARTMLLDLLAQHPGYAPAEQALQRLKQPTPGQP